MKLDQEFYVWIYCPWTHLLGYAYLCQSVYRKYADCPDALVPVGEHKSVKFCKPLWKDAADIKADDIGLKRFEEANNNIPKDGSNKPLKPPVDPMTGKAK